MSQTTIPVLWTNDDVCFGQASHHRRQLEFLDRRGIPGTFFVIPSQGDFALDKDKELLRLIESSRARGHEYYQHGFVHSPFESGVPELQMLDFSPETRASFDAKRFEIEASHTFEALVAMLQRGQRVWRHAFGEESIGYRPGWGAYCANLYRAVGALGYQWISSRLPCMTSWLWNQGHFDAPLDFRGHIPTRPHRVEGALEIPIAGDYAFRVTNDPVMIDRMVDLGLREFEVYVQRGDPMLIVSHWHGLERNDHAGYAVHDRLLAKLRDSGQARFMRMSELVAQVA